MRRWRDSSSVSSDPPPSSDLVSASSEAPPDGTFPPLLMVMAACIGCMGRPSFGLSALIATESGEGEGEERGRGGERRERAVVCVSPRRLPAAGGVWVGVSVWLAVRC